MYEELVKRLREDAEWAEANEWETPIMLSDNLKQAANAIEERCRQVDKFAEEAARLYAKQPKWIPINEHPPELGEVVIGYNRDRVYKGTVQSIDLCEYQGALYCKIFSPSFRGNQFPVVHYSLVFLSRQAAEEYADYQKNPDGVFPDCMGCHYNAMKNAVMND